MALHAWLLYLVAAIGLSLTPGPNSMLVLTHGALHGHRRALFTVTGGVVGFTTLIGLSMLGIGAVHETSASALTVLKLAGGAYLVWLGVQLWRAPPIDLRVDATARDTRGAVLFRQGLLAAITNPKALLFYGAFLPQFIEQGRDLASQFVVMALTFAVVESIVEYLLARLAHRIRPALQRAGKKFNRLCGGMFVAVGAALPMTR